MEEQDKNLLKIRGKGSKSYPIWIKTAKQKKRYDER